MLSFAPPVSAAAPFAGRFDTIPKSGTKVKTRPGGRTGTPLGHALLLQMLVSGSAPQRSATRRQSLFTPNAVVYEEGPAPSVEASLRNGVSAEDWSGPASQDWDGNELEGGSQSLPAIAGLLAVAGAGFFCTRAVTSLFNHRADLARIVPHPVAVSVTSDATSPRSSMSDDGLRARPLSPGTFEGRMEDRGTSPIPQQAGIERSTSMGSLARVGSTTRDFGQQTSDIDDDNVSVTSAADAIDVASTVSSLESSDLDGLDVRDVAIATREAQSELPQFRSLTPELIQQLPKEYTVGTLRKRAQLAMKAASTATEAAQRASAFSAAASTASAAAAKASNRAMSAAAMAHMALESGNIDDMTHAQTEAWKSLQLAAESEKRAAEAAALATAYEDLSEQQSKVARELARPPPRNLFKEFTQAVSSFFHPVTAAIVGFTSAIAQWFVSVWTYFSSGTFWHQVCSLCSNSVSFVSGLFVSAFEGVKNAVLFVFANVTGFFTYVGNGIKHGFDSCLRFFKVLYTRIFNSKGSIGGEASA